MLLSADWIYTPEGWLSGHLLETDGAGRIVSLRLPQAGEQPEHFPGILMPGFVNAHCHLELSMLHGAIPPGCGMTAFASAVVRQRGQYTEAEQREALRAAMADAWQTGTSAIGDICNTTLSAADKRAFPALHFSNFIELLGLDESRAAAIWEAGQHTLAAFGGMEAALTLHAPYSVSAALRARFAASAPQRASFHLLESADEVALFAHGGGALPRWFGEMGIAYSAFSQQDPAQHLLEGFSASLPLLLVHLTEASSAQLAWIAAQFPQSHFCLCPRSNLYIHNTLPDLQKLAPYADRICLGSDSLASNSDLNLLEEVYTLVLEAGAPPLHTLLRWASTQGAQALGLAARYGSFMPGQQPGILHIGPVAPGPALTENSRVRRVF